MPKINIQAQASNYQINEAYKRLRTNIEFLGKNVKVIAITSCEPNEGKSSISFGLAETLAESGKRVILIDADLRKSVLVGRLHIRERTKGMSHYLSGQGIPKEIICETNIPNLWAIFAGPVPPNPAELLGDRKFASLIGNLRSLYDYVIIDTPPLGSVVDSVVVSRVCDGIAMVVAAGSTSYKFAQSVKQEIDRAGIRFLGVIMNKVNTSGYYGRRYSGYYGYGNYYGTEKKD